MSETSVPGGAITLRYRDIGEMAEAIGIARSEFIATERGGFDGWLLRADLGRLSFESGGESRSHLGRAGIGAGRALAFLLLDHSGPQISCGHDLDVGRIMLYRPGAEYQGASRGRRTWAGLSLPVDDLEAALRAIAGDGAALLAEPHRLVEPPPHAVEALRRTIEEARAALERDPSILASEGARRGLEQDLLAALVGAVASDGASPPDRTRLGHARVVGRADEFLRERLGEPIYLVDLCRATGVSERTLRNAFHEMYGVGPNRFLKLRRLHQVRRALASPAPGARVSALAARHGFWDLGRFAADYRALFDESPSETLRRGLAPQLR